MIDRGLLEESLTFEQAEALLQQLAGDVTRHAPSRPAVPEPTRGTLGPDISTMSADAQTFTAPRWSEKTFLGLLEAAPDGIVVINQGGTIVRVNSQTEKMFGYPREELLGGPIEILVPERLRAGHVGKRAEFFKKPHTRPMGSGLALFGRHKSGREFPVEISLGVLEADDGILVTSAIRDVSERKEREAMLRKAEARYRSLVEEIPAVTFMAALDEGLNELYVSPQIEELLGFSQKEWLEDPVLWFKQLHPDDRDRWHIEFAQTCATAKPFRAVYRFLTRTGDVVWVHGEAKVFRDDEGRPLFLQGVAFDITGMKRAEEKLTALNLTLERRVAERSAEAEKLAAEAEKRADELARSNDALKEFASAVAHEVDEPVRTMKNFSQLLSRRYTGKLDETADDWINRIVNAGSRGHEFVLCLYDYGNVGRKGKLELVNCYAILAEACDGLKATFEETGARLNVKGFDSVNAAAVKWELVLLLRNLIGNALKFHGERPIEIDVEVQRQGNNWVFSVRDNGIGIPADKMHKLFSMGQGGRLHTRSEIPGHGIGLATCKKIVERHGGNIWIDSVPDQGSTFFFTVPAQPMKPS